MQIDFWFEFGSTYSYPAALRIESLAAARRVRVAWRAFLLGPLFAEQGWRDSPFNLYPAKGRYMWRDLERVCQAQGLPFRRPSEFPRNGLLAARVACHFAEAPWLPAFVRAVYRANFESDRAIETPEVVAHCLEAAGAEPTSVLEAARSPEAKGQLRAQTEEAARPSCCQPATRPSSLPSARQASRSSANSVGPPKKKPLRRVLRLGLPSAL